MNIEVDAPAQEPIGIRSFFAMFRGKAFKPTIILLYAALALSIWRYIPPAPLLTDETAAVQDAISVRAPIQNDWSSFLYGETRILAALLIMGIIPAIMVRFVFREKLSDYGLCWGNFFTLRSMLLVTPFLLVVGWCGSLDTSFALIYPYNRLINGSMNRFLIHLFIFYPILYIAWEFMFRGFMLHGLVGSCGIFNAILISTLASTMLHYGHPLTEVLGSVGGGLFWGFLAFRTGSILSGTVQHASMGMTLLWFLVSTSMH